MRPVSRSRAARMMHGHRAGVRYTRSDLVPPAGFEPATKGLEDRSASKSVESRRACSGIDPQAKP